MNDDRKSEQKSLAHQLSKCLNEKRRREQENIYIEELAELISASITDMNTLSVKPDKCAILQETVNQIRRIKEEESGTSEAVQQSQVSSSKPSIIANDVLGPLLLEALDGFLFVVNSHGKVEFVSENVASYLKYSSNDLVEKSIYNIIHVGDHAQFSNSLLPMSLAHTGTTPNNITDDNGVLFSAETLGNKGRTFNCRMLIKPPGEEDGDVEVKQTYVSKYENMQISAVLQPYPDKQDNSTVGQSCLVCIARRLPLAEKTMLGIEQFTTKQDLNGKIIDCDTRGIAPSQYDYPDFKGHNLQDFCHVNDIQLLAKHIQEVKKNSQGTSSVYRFKLLENRYVFVRTQSRLFNNTNSQPDFIVSTHSIIRECDSDAELKGSASTSLMKSIVAPLNSSSNKTGGSFQSVTNTLQGMGMLTGRNLNMYVPHTSLGAAPSASPVSALGGAPVNMGDMFNLSDVFDILPQSLNLFSSADTLNVSANSVNYTMAGATSSVTTPSSSSHTTWSNSTSLKMAAGSMDQSQMQRSVSMTHNPMSGQRGLSLNFQRSASLFDNGQKTPGYAGNPGPGTCNPNFAIPSPRGTGYGNYHNQRSPGSAGQLDGGRGSTQFSPLPYPQAKSTSPLMSPQPSGNWSRPPSSGSMEFPQQAQNPLQALQSMDTNPPSGGYGGGSKDKQFIYPTTRAELHARRTSTDKKVNQSAKLTQLLTQNNPPPPEKSFCKALEEVDVPIPYRDDPISKMGLIRNSIFSDSKSDNSQQSPQPGPGTSPPEKPQSTSGNDDLDHVGRSMGDIARRREENKILKQLLSQDDDLEDVVEKASAASSEQNMEVDNKNEAEPKKSNNILLKQLLNEEAQLDDKEQKANEKLQKLLQAELTVGDDNPFDINRSVSAPVESTSLETENFSTVTTSADSSRTRHQSGPQQPTSTTQPTTAPMPQSKNGNAVLSPGGSMPGNSNLFKSLFPGGDSLGQADKLMQGKVFNMIMTNLWEKGNTDSDDTELRLRNKRKLSMDVDSTDDMDITEPPTSSVPLRNLSKRNVLLAKLLARKPPQENVVNTNITVNPCGIPQSKVAATRNNTQKVVHVLDKVEHPNEVEKDSGTMHNPRDNPRTNPNVPFPGNTTPATAGQQQQQHHHQQSSAVPDGFGTTHTEPSVSEAHSALRQGLANLSNEQLLRYQQELNLRRGVSGTGASLTPKVMSSMSMEVDPSAPDGADPSDPLLAQILQQAQELQNDLNSGSLNSVSSSNMATTDGTSNPFGSMMDDTTLLSQLDMVLKDSNLSMTEIDNLLGINNQPGGALVPTDMSEQMAINAIQKQLMSDSVSTPSPNNLPPNSASSSAPMTTGTRLPNSNQAFPHSLMQQQQQPQPHPPNTQLPPMDLPFPHGQQMAPGLNQPAPGYTQQGPRLPQPQALGNALAGSQNRPGFGNTSPNSMAYQVRQTLLMRQKQKQIRELEKRERIRQQQRQQQQQLLLRQQQAQQFNQFPQRFQNPIGMDTGNNPNFPENLGELMKSGNAPNVTLPRNQQSLPNPMSPRFVGGNMAQNQPQQQQQQQQALQNMTPPPQLSPHYNQQKAGPGQWGTNRVSQSGLQPGMLPSPTMGQVQSSQFGMRSRQLSGSSMPSPGGQPTGGRFPYPADTQFNNVQSGMYSQSQGGMSQQALFTQNRLMQRQLNVTGRGSPRTPHSPFGGASDGMLMSPHGQPAMSPNSSMRNQSQVAGSQLSPQFSQNSLQQSYSTQALSSNYAQSPSPSVTGSYSPQHVNLNSSAYAPSPSQNNVGSLTNQPGFQDFDMSMFNNMGGLDNKVPVSLGTDLGNLGNNPVPTSTSQYVKQELRNICNARSEKQLQTQQSHANPLDPQQDQLQQTLDFNSDDISYNSILDEIDQMTQQHNLNPPVEDNVLLQSRQEARLRYEKFCQLSHPALRQAPQYTAPQHTPEESTFKQDADVKAANLFRNQLLSNPSSGQQPNKSTLEQPHHVNIVQNEPRAPCEDMKPADQKNSLLQQLLSE